MLDYLPYNIAAFLMYRVSVTNKKSLFLFQAQTDEENLDGTVMEASDDEDDADSDKDFDYLMGKFQFFQVFKLLSCQFFRFSSLKVF